MKRYTPKILIKYLIKEFAFSLLIFTLIFSSLIILTTFVEELIFFKEKQINNNFFLKIFILTLIKSPTLIFNFSPFIFLFSGIFFYVKFLKNKERIASEQATIKDNEWHLHNVNITSETSVRNLKNYIYTSAINLEKLKSYFSNSDIYSIWNINSQLEEIRDRGYYGQELIIKLNKQLSLPFLLFSMIIISTLFTIKVNYSFNNFIYIFLGILIGIVVYFINDLSIALGESGKIPLILSVWMPVILLMIYSTYSLIRSYD